jgi:Ser/Thr protein kinase RdoA (MazF antagonist)
MLKADPITDHTGLAKVLRRAYGLSIDRLTFVPAGWTDGCYVVECTGGERYFLKLSSDSGLVPYAASDRDFYLPLTHQLCTKRILPHIACPVRTKDRRFTVDWEDYLLILFHFIEGQVVGFDSVSGDVLRELASLIGVLHRSTLHIEVEKPLVEKFDIAFEDNLMEGLETLAGITPSDRPGRWALRKLLLPLKDELLGRLDRLRELQALARASDREMVACHTDLHGGNLMMGEQGELYIIDWEGAMIAPPEQDLFFFAGYDTFWDELLPIYEGENGPVDLDSDVFGFYCYRRNLENLMDYVVRILHYSAGDEQDRQDLEEMNEDCIAGWPHLEPTIRQISERLAQRKQKKV